MNQDDKTGVIQISIEPYELCGNGLNGNGAYGNGVCGNGIGGNGSSDTELLDGLDEIISELS